MSNKSKRNTNVRNNKTKKTNHRTLRVRLIAITCACLLVGSCLAVVLSVFHI